MTTIARPLEFVSMFEAVTGKLKTDLNLTEASNWIAAKTACDDFQQGKNTADEIAKQKTLAMYLNMVEKGLGKRKVTLFNKLELMCIDEIKYLINGYPSINSVFPVITQYRNAFRAINNAHIALAFFKLPKSEYADRRTNYRIAVKTALGDKRPYHNECGFIQQAKDMLNSDSYACVAMGLCLLTGRRPTEILLTAKFHKVDGAHNVMVFSGQLKTKDSELARDNYLIPVLADSDLIINALAKLRSMRDFSSLPVLTGKTLAQQVNSKTAKTQSETVIRYFSEYLPTWINADGKKETAKPYNLRQVYLDMVWRSFVNGGLNLAAIPELKKDDKNMFCSNILGHSKDDLATVNSYMRVKYE